MSKYFNMNEVPIGSKVRIKSSNLVGNISEVFHFPTTFKVVFNDDSFKIYKTHEIEFLKEDSDSKESNE